MIWKRREAGARNLPYIAMIHASSGGLGMERTSGIAARRAGMKFNQQPAATEDQVWQ